MLFRSKKTRTHSRQRGDFKRRQLGLRLCRLEPLESRRLLSAFDLASYDLNINSTLSGTSATELSGAAYSDVTDSFYLVDDGGASKMIEYKPDGTFVREIAFNNFNDLEGIVHMGGTRFAVIEEDNQGAANGQPQSFHLDILTIPTTGTTAIDKNDLTADLPNEGTIVLTHAQLREGGDGNSGPEGIAYDSDGGFFYVAKEKDDVRLWRFKDDVAVADMKLVDIPGVTDDPVPDSAAELLKDLSEIYFTDDVGGAGGRLFLMSDPSQKIIMADVDDSDPNDLSAAVVMSGGVPVEIDVSMTKPEGFSFTSDSFILFTVADQNSRPFKQYRNFTVFDPTGAPDLHVDSDTGVCVDDVTTATQLTFEGTLTRDGGAAVADAYVFLYVQIDQTGAYSQTGTAVETDVNGKYTVTSSTDLALGTHNFRIRVGENSNTPDAKKSLESNSESLAVEIKTNTGSEDVADLTGDCYIDFDDLTILLSNWAEEDPYPTVGEGNIIDPQNTSIDYQDLTYLLAYWTGPTALDDPQKALAKPSQDYTDTIYSTSTDFFVQFDAAVTGAGASDLELSGAGGSGDITYVSGGAWVGLKEWTFTRSPLNTVVYALSA